MKKMKKNQTPFLAILALLFSVAFSPACAVPQAHPSAGAGGAGAGGAGGGVYQMQMNAEQAVKTKASQDYDCPPHEITLRLLERENSHFKYRAGVCGFPMTFVSQCQDASTCEASLEMQ